MDKITVYLERQLNILTVQWGNPSTEVTCENVADDLILMKDAHGNVIGIEKLHALTPSTRMRDVQVEVREAEGDPSLPDFSRVEDRPTLEAKR